MSLEKCLLDTNNKTDKYDLGYISEFYDNIFSPIQNDVGKVLEIGIYEGNSIKLWNDFFHNATVYGADINYCEALNSYPKVKATYGNAYSLDFFNQFEKNSFDVVIDDGPHTYESMVFFLTHYIDLVKPNGFCILEDIINIYWTPLLINLIKHRTDINFQIIDMRFKQKTEFLYERWKYGLDVMVIKKLK